jgi:hypothetical protein
MDIKKLRVGMQCTTSDGSLIEIEALEADNIHVRVKYLDTMDNPDLPPGEVRDVPFEELIAEFMGTHAEGLT